LFARGRSCGGNMNDIPNYSKARSAAIELLESAGLSEPPVDPVSISRNLGVQVFFVEFGGENDRNVSGFYDCEDDVIMVNKHEFPLRQTFTVAHELGHKVLHEEWAKSDNYRVLLRDPSIRESNPIEQEANHFAANLLMPQFMMDNYYTLPVSQLSRLFAVSVPAVRNRLQSLYGI
jgi:Zn-dependent peptidase ImmA (M78 family)